MYTVIDTIEYNKSWMHKIPELAAHPEGLLLILEPEEISKVPEIKGRTALIERPDGTTLRLRIDHYEIRHRVVGVFFNDLSSSEVPRLSRIRWDEDQLMQWMLCFAPRHRSCRHTTQNTRGIITWATTIT